MLNKKPRIRKTSAKAFIALVLLAGSGLTQSCTQDVLEGQPSWLGNSFMSSSRTMAIMAIRFV